MAINNPDYGKYLGQMNPTAIQIKDTTESNTSACYLDLLLTIGLDGQLRIFIYDKRDDFNFQITNFQFHQYSFFTRLWRICLVAYTFTTCRCKIKF